MFAIENGKRQAYQIHQLEILDYFTLIYVHSIHRDMKAVVRRFKIKTDSKI